MVQLSVQKTEIKVAEFQHIFCRLKAVKKSSKTVVFLMTEN